MKVPSFAMPSMDPVKNAARATGNAVVAGAKETSRVVAQTTVATAALVKLVALAVLTAAVAPVLYFASNTRFEALKGRTADAFQNMKAQTRAIVYNPEKAAAKAAPQTRVEAIVARLSAAASAVKANKGKSAALAFAAVAGAALYYNGVPVVVTETASRLADYFFPARVVTRAAEDAENICQNLAPAGKVCTVAQFDKIQEALLSGKGIVSQVVGKIVA